MKTTLCSLLSLVLATLCYADIQSPPAADYGPTRKLGRGIGNLVWGITELPVTVTTLNTYEGNSTAASYGIVRGVGRSFARMFFGVREIVTFPFPDYKGSYRPPYSNVIPWIHRGYQEFPPELGFESKYKYCREY